MQSSGEKLQDIESEFFFVAELCLDELSWSVMPGNDQISGVYSMGARAKTKANKIVADYLSKKMNEGWPMFHDRDWALREGYLDSDGRPTEEGVLLYDEITRMVKGLNASAEVLPVCSRYGAEHIRFSSSKC